MYWLIPRLAEFRALHPGIEVRLSTAQGVADRGRDADLFIRRDPAHFAGLAATPFMTEYAALVPALFLEALIAGGSLREVPGTAPFASGSYSALVRPEPSAEAMAFVAWLSSAGDLAIAPGGE